MAEVTSDRKVFTLLEVTRSIQKTIAERYKSTFWVKAEMIKLNHYSHSGHCYPDLVEKKDGKVVAQIRANLWRSDFERVNRNFLKILKEPIKDGITILFLGSISFEPTHGLCLRIHDVDPVFSLGELEREKQESIERLTRDGLFNANKQLKLPLLPQRIAVISVETSKGFADYKKVLDENPWGYSVINILFPSILQGDKAVWSIIEQLGKIRNVLHHFDAVAIIRGGGGDVGLSSFNNYELARAVASFPIPIFTGIGHSTNETVTEMVAFKNAITPTELADIIIQKFHSFSEPVDEAVRLIREEVPSLLSSHTKQLTHLLSKFKLITNVSIQRPSHALATVNNSLTVAARSFVTFESHRLELTQNQVKAMDPVNILKRGFSITTDEQGNVIRSVQQIKAGTTIVTRVSDGEFTGEVKSLKSSEA